MEILLIVIIGSFVASVTLFGVFWAVDRLRKKEYEHDYIFLASSVRYWGVSHQTYNKIIHMFTEINLSKGNDPVRTKELWEEFRQKYAAYDKETINMNKN